MRQVPAAVSTGMGQFSWPVWGRVGRPFSTQSSGLPGLGSLVLIRAAVQHPVIGVVGTRRGVLARFLGEIRSLRFVRVFRLGRLFRRGGLLGFRGFVRFLRLVGFFRHVRRGGGRQRAHLGQGVHIVEVRVLLHQRHRHQERVDLLIPGGSGALDDEIQAQRQP